MPASALRRHTGTIDPHVRIALLGIAVSVLASLIAGAPVVAYHSFIPAAILDRVHRAKLARSDAHLTSNTANSMQAAQTSQAGGDTGVGHEDSEGAGADFSRIWYSAVPTMHLLLLEAAEAEARVAYRGLEHVSPVVTSDRGEDWDTHRTAIGTRVTPLAAKHCGPLHPSSIAPMPPDGGLLFIRNCSAALLPSIAARLEACLGCEVLPTYAMTESMPISANPRGGGRLLRSVGLSSGPEIRVVKPASSGSVPASAPSALDTSSGSQGVEQVGIVCALGEEGEVCVRGSCVTAGYELRPHMNADPNLTSFYSRLITVDGVAKLTSKISVSDDAFDKPGDGGATLSKEGVDAGSDESAYTEASGRWLRTGDKGMMASNGHLYLSGRFKEIINRAGELKARLPKGLWHCVGRLVVGGAWLLSLSFLWWPRYAGEKISPFEVEDALRSELASNPYVKDLLAFSVPHRYLGEVVGVALALAPGTQPADRPTLRMLRSLGRRKLSLKWCPQVLVYFPSDGGTSMDSNRVGSPSGLPKGPTGKPARIALAERLSLPTIGGSPALTAPPEASAPAVDAGASQLSAALKSLSVEAPALRDAVDTWEVVGSAHGATGPIEARPCPPINSEPQPQRPSNGVDLDSSCGGPVRRRLEGSILQQLRVIWAEVLQLPTDAEDDMDDDVPFAAMGGDSLLGAMIIRAAHSRGILLHMSLAAEMEEHTLRSLAATMHQMDEVGTDTDGATAGWKDEEVSIWRDDSQASEVLPQIGHHEDRLLHSTFTAIVVAAPKSTPAAPRALRIIERDCRKPRSALTHVGGLTACAMGATVEAAALFASGKWDPIHAVDKHGNTSLMWASGAGHLHTVEWLLSGEVGVPIDAANKDGRTALMWACKNGQYEVVKNLIDVHGADSSLRMKDDSTAFDWAVLGGDVSTMELMVRQPSVDIHALNRFGCAAVQWAAAAGNVETCRWLLSKGFDLGHVNDARHGAVVKAAWKGHLSLLHWLLLDPGGPGLNWQLYMPDLEGRSVAELAVMNGQIEVADWLQKLVDERSRHEISG